MDEKICFLCFVAIKYFYIEIENCLLIKNSYFPLEIIDTKLLKASMKKTSKYLELILTKA